jgi:hypothetical protein
MREVSDHLAAAEAAPLVVAPAPAGPLHVTNVAA